MEKTKQRYIVLGYENGEFKEPQRFNILFNAFIYFTDLANAVKGETTHRTAYDFYSAEAQTAYTIFCLEDLPDDCNEIALYGFYAAGTKGGIFRTLCSPNPDRAKVIFKDKIKILLSLNTTPYQTRLKQESHHDGIDIYTIESRYKSSKTSKTTYFFARVAVN